MGLKSERWYCLGEIPGSTSFLCACCKGTRVLPHRQAIAEQALRESAVTIKGKGGKIRTVPISESISIELKKLLAVTLRGHKLFVPDGVSTDIAIARLQQYIYQVRPRFRTRTPPVP